MAAPNARPRERRPTWPAALQGVAAVSRIADLDFQHGEEHPPEFVARLYAAQLAVDRAMTELVQGVVDRVLGVAGRIVDSQPLHVAVRQLNHLPVVAQHELLKSASIAGRTLPDDRGRGFPKTRYSLRTLL